MYFLAIVSVLSQPGTGMAIVSVLSQPSTGLAIVIYIANSFLQKSSLQVKIATSEVLMNKA